MEIYFHVADLKRTCVTAYPNLVKKNHKGTQNRDISTVRKISTAEPAVPRTEWSLTGGGRLQELKILVQI